jgi:hypothetical protein
MVLEIGAGDNSRSTLNQSRDRKGAFAGAPGGSAPCLIAFFVGAFGLCFNPLLIGAGALISSAHPGE